MASPALRSPAHPLRRSRLPCAGLTAAPATQHPSGIVLGVLTDFETRAQKIAMTAGVGGFVAAGGTAPYGGAPRGRGVLSVFSQVGGAAAGSGGPWPVSNR